MLKIPPPIWMFIYLAIAIVASVLYRWRALTDWQSVPLGIVLVVIGAGFAFWGRYTFFAEKTEIMPTSATNAKLVRHGPFAVTRNPMYLGLVLLTLGIAFWAGSLPLFLVPIALFATTNWIHIPFEEEKMRRQYGADFDGYTAQVRRWM